jgi:outer membrane immunogenic protein
MIGEPNLEPVFKVRPYFNVLQLGTSLHTIKGGINYHFGGPVVAKY